MALSNTTKNAMLDAGFVTGDLISLHTADPGTTGANEATGGTLSATETFAAQGTYTLTSATVTVP